MGPFAGFALLASIITMSIAASLEAHWNNVGFPNKSYRDRERILLAAGIWGIIISGANTLSSASLEPNSAHTRPRAVYSLFGTIFAPGSTAFGIFPHLITFTIAFILYLVGASSLTALTDKVTCSNAAETFSRCNTTKALVGAWIGTIYVFLILVFVSILGIKARSGVGARKGALTDA
uniref:MARVEL domain-containing protein n=1 Tax=Rhodotorula toruloides TaxID=5286 RepID=A0A0K3CHR8_RHOTO